LVGFAQMKKINKTCTKWNEGCTRLEIEIGDLYAPIVKSENLYTFISKYIYTKRGLKKNV